MIDVGEPFKLADALYGNIHQLRETRQGIQYLKETGQFRDYMESRVGGDKEFIAWDGEGWTDNDGEHRYMLLMNSKGSHIEYPRLDSARCLELMLKVAAENRKAIHVIYGGGYDVTHILRDMPEDKRAELLETNQTTWLVDDPEHNLVSYQFEYLPHKWFTIRGYEWTTRRKVTMKIFDVMTFFQTSFVNALRSRNIEVPETVIQGKLNRGEFTFADLDSIKAYCQLELEKLVELCNVLRDEIHETGIRITQFHGPGAVASAVFKHYGVRRHMSPPSDELEKAAAGAYFGGRFEQFKAGHYAGRVFVYDINSAYPHHIRNLPSLMDATWEYTQSYDPNVVGIWFSPGHDFSPDYDSPHPLPWRGYGGTVGFPAIHQGVWLWHPESSLADSIDYGFVLRRYGNVVRPFSFIEGMYETRKEWKAQGRGGERALKLEMNSLYGKTCQRVGGSEKYGGRPPWHQLEWGGMVTSATRRQLWDAVSQKPHAIIAVETDSVTSTEPLDLDCGSGLGQWELTEYDWITYIQSGVYFTSGDSNGHKAKTRGIDVRELDHGAVLDWLATDMQEPLLLNARNFIGIGNPRTALYGQWTDSIKELRVGGGKRVHVPGFCRACQVGRTFAEGLHTLIANPIYGTHESVRHSLPWRNDNQGWTATEESPMPEAVEDYQ